MEIKIKKVLFSEQKLNEKSVGFVELNHAPALNALDTGMLADIEKRLMEWENDSSIALVVFHSENPKAFCAGGDVKKLVLETREKGLKIAMDFFTQEYFTDVLVHRFKKPILAWLDGITMGGGVGLTQGASHRVVTEKTMLSMPEVFIGLFPDVGATGFLPQLKDGFGYFLGLSGARLGGALGYEMGWQNYFIESSKKRKIFSDLLRMDWLESAEENREILSQYLDHMMSLGKDSDEKLNFSDADQKLMSHWKSIKSEFQKALLEKNFSKLIECVNKTEGTDGRARSVLSQALFYEMSQKLIDKTWEQVLALEWIASVEMSKGASFPEGVRAVLLDKDHKPKWPELTPEQALSEAREILSRPIDNLLVRRFEAGE